MLKTVEHLEAINLYILDGEDQIRAKRRVNVGLTFV